VSNVWQLRTKKGQYMNEDEEQQTCGHAETRVGAKRVWSIARSADAIADELEWPVALQTRMKRDRYVDTRHKHWRRSG
jgi:hypothetical protein